MSMKYRATYRARNLLAQPHHEHAPATKVVTSQEEKPKPAVKAYTLTCQTYRHANGAE